MAYHSISDIPSDEWTVSPAQLEAHLRLLKEQGFEICTLPDLVGCLENGLEVSGKVCLTFDDGFRDFRENALSILQAWGAPAVVFIPMGKVGGVSDWSQSAPYRSLMNWKDLEVCRQAGITIGGHGMNHCRLIGLPSRVALEEFEITRDLLTEQLGIGDHHFAYPYGEASERERGMAKACGYRSAFIFGGLWGNAADSDRWGLTREPIRGNTHLSDIKSILSGWRDIKELMRCLWE